MARDRKYIRVNDLSEAPVLVSKGGRELHGLSLHKKTGQFYSIDPATHKRKYHGKNLEAAIKEHEPVDIAILSDMAKIMKAM